MTKKGTITLPGKSHSVPRGIVPFILDLEEFEGVKNVGIGKFIPRTNGRGIKAEVKWYCENQKFIKVDADCKGFRQALYVTIPESEDLVPVTDFIEYYPTIQYWLKRYRHN
jgi:hypothetical protein